MKNNEHTERETAIKSFTPEAALETFNAGFLSESKCTAWVLNALHPQGPHCPECEIKIYDQTTIGNFWALCRCRCKNCGKFFNALTGTMLHGSQLDQKQVYLVALGIALELPVKAIAKFTGITEASVYAWQKRFEFFANFKPEPMPSLNFDFNFDKPDLSFLNEIAEENINDITAG